jgi:dephospho-CoA kinase
MKVIGLAGRAGSGKSAVARHLARDCGTEWIDLDAVAWGTYGAGTDTHARLVDAFGPRILNGTGDIDRARLAEAAFADRSGRDTLDAIVHPAVSAAVKRIIAEHRGKATALLLIEGALLASSPHVDRSDYDLIVWLDVPEDVRASRLRAAGREAHRLRGRDISPAGEVVVVDASGTIEQTAARVLRAVSGS